MGAAVTKYSIEDAPAQSKYSVEDSAAPRGEGTYPMWDTAGHKTYVPYSQVPVKRGQGYQFDTNPYRGNLTPAQAFSKDEAADPNRTGGTSLTMAPRGATWNGQQEPQSRQESIQRLGESEKNASLPIRLLTGAAKGGATLAKPAVDAINLATGQNTPGETSEMMAPHSGAEAGAKYAAVAAPLIAGGVVAPAAMAGGLLGGAAGGYAGGAAGRAMGLDPNQTELLSDAGGLVGGVGGAELGTMGGQLLSEPMQAGGGGLINRAAGLLKKDFAHGAENPGRSYLEGGGTPAMTMRGLANKAEAVQDTAGQKLGEAYDAASQPSAPQPVRGLLQAPEYDVPLQPSPSPRNPRMRPMAFDAKVNPEEPMEPRSGDPMAPISDYPGINPQYLSGSAHPELSGRVPTTQGVLRTRNPEIAGQVLSPEETGTPFPTGATRIAAGDVRSALLDPVNRLRGIQNGPGGVGASPLLDEYESGIRSSTGQDFTPRALFDLKRNVAANTRWNDPTMFDMNSVRQQGVGRIGGLLTDAVPETAPLNRIYQGAGNLAERAGSRADTGSPPFTSLVNRGLEGAAGIGLGYATHNPFLAAAPLLIDSVPVKTGAGYLLYHGGQAVGTAPNPLSLGLIGTGSGTAGKQLLPQEKQ